MVVLESGVFVIKEFKARNMSQLVGIVMYQHY